MKLIVCRVHLTDSAAKLLSYLLLAGLFFHISDQFRAVRKRRDRIVSCRIDLCSKRHQPIIAEISMLVCSGATPIAMVKATMPSIRPDDLFFESLRLESSLGFSCPFLTPGASTIALAAHIA